MVRSSKVRTTVLLAVALCGAAGATGGEVVVKVPEKSIPYGPIPTVAPVGMSLADGVMLKEGRPYFWIGQGDGPGACQHGPVGLWLVCLQGTDGVTLNKGCMKMSITAVTTLPNAAPITTPIARSMTLPFIANSLNSLTSFPICETSLSCFKEIPTAGYIIAQFNLGIKTFLLHFVLIWHAIMTFF